MKTLSTCFVATFTASFTLGFQAVAAEEQAMVHPSTTPEVRLASWWLNRHAEKIAEIEAANDPKKNKSIELLMVG
ncbi:MAG: hypothetical protein ABGZ08_10550, partial [Akkermansiaceae bacterium]